MTNDIPVTGKISNTTKATLSSHYYLVQWDEYYNKWYNTNTPYNQEFTLTWSGGGGTDGYITTATSVNKYYTLQIDGLSYSNRQAVLMETDNFPQSFNSNSSEAVITPSVVYAGQDVIITINLAGNKSTQEKVFVRYSKDNFTNSKVVEALGSGNNWSTAIATIPAIDNNSGTVKYYAYSTTVAATNSSNHDLISLKLANNGGSNYSYTISTSGFSITQADGNWASGSTWIGNIVPASGLPVIIAHNVTLDQVATVSFLAINSGKAFTASNASAKTLTIAKSVSGNSTTLSNSGTWLNGTGGSTVIFTGAPSGSDAIHTISGTIAFQNITVNKTGVATNVGVSFGAGSSVSSTLEIGKGGYVSSSPPTGFYVTNAILKFNQGTGATYDVESYDNSWSTSVIPNYITISSGTVNLKDARTATGNLLIDGGTLTLNAPLTIQGNWTRSSGTFTPNTQPVTLSGATNTLIDVAGGATLYDLVVNKTGSGYVSLSSNLTISHNLTISGGVLTIPATRTLTVSGTLANSVGNTGLVIKSDATGTGSLKQNTDNVPATVERYIIAADWADALNGWHLLSSPVSSPNQSISGVWTPDGLSNNDYDFYMLDESELINSWRNQKVSGNSITHFIPGSGYMVAYEETPVLPRTFAGLLTTSDVTLSGLSYTASSPYPGFHLVGNPFACAINWNSGSWTKTYIDANAYIWKAGAYVSTATPGYNVIPATNGFMVRVNTSAGELKIPADSRDHQSQNWYKSSPEMILLKANDLSNEMVQTSIVRFDAQATTGYDTEFDSYFVKGYAPTFYSIFEGNKLLLNTLPVINESLQIPFTFIKNSSENFSIELKLSIDGLPVYLTDLKTNTDQNLSENPVYTFTSEAGDDPNRFLLHFLNTTGTAKLTSSTIKVYSAPGKINISGVDGKAEILVRNIMGQVVLSNSVKGSALQSLNTNNLPSGVYVVSVVSGKQTVSEKVVVR